MVFGTIAVASIAPAFLFHYLSFLGKKKGSTTQGRGERSPTKNDGTAAPKAAPPKREEDGKKPSPKGGGGDNHFTSPYKKPVYFTFKKL